MKKRVFGNENDFLNLTFSERVAVLTLLVPPGRVTTYGDIAKAAGGGAMAAQSITTILSKFNLPEGLSIPFHRIVYADGTIWYDDNQRESRLSLYQAEGIVVTSNDKVAHFEAKRFDFKSVTTRQLTRQTRQFMEAISCAARV